MISYTHVDGNEPCKLKIYTLSTCGWCKKTKALLNELGVGYDYIDVDLVDSSDLDEVRKEIQKWNPSFSFPTIVVNDERSIIGFKEDELRRLAEK